MGKVLAFGLAVSLAGALYAGFGSAAEPPPVEAYGRLPAIENPRLSPDGARLAYLSSVGGRRCLVVHALDDDRPDKVVCPGIYEVRWFAWKTDQRLVLEVYAPVRLAGLEPHTENRIVAVDASGGHFRDLADSKAQRAIDFGQDEVIDMLPGDREHILAAVYRSDPNSPDVVRVNVDTGVPTVIVDGQKKITNWKTDAAGQVRAGFAVENGIVKTYYRDDARSNFRLIHEVETSHAFDFSLLAVGDSPGSLYVSSTGPTGRRAVYRYDVPTASFVETYAGRDDADITTLIMDRGRPLGYGFTIDEPQQVYTDPGSQLDAAQVALALPGFRTSIADETASGRRILVFAAGGNRPGSYYLLTRAKGQAVLSELGNVRPDIPDSALAPVMPVSYRARDGLTIHGYVTLPPGVSRGPIPFVVMPHGGPSSRDILGFDYIAQMIASRGYGVFQPNYRGSRGYGAAFEEAGFAQWGLAMQDDVTDGTHWLIDQKLAAPSRICIMGWSYGGYAALMGAIKTPDLYRCAASMAAVTDLRQRLDRAARSRFADINLPRYDSDPAVIETNSPVLHADRVEIPILLAHGRRDFTVPVEDSEAMENALRRAGKQVETIYFPEDDHFLYREEDRIAFLKTLDRFLADNLGLGAQAAPGAGATN